MGVLGLVYTRYEVHTMLVPGGEKRAHQLVTGTDAAGTVYKYTRRTPRFDLMTDRPALPPHTKCTVYY